LADVGVGGVGVGEGPAGGDFEGEGVVEVQEGEESGPKTGGAGGRQGGREDGKGAGVGPGFDEAPVVRGVGRVMRGEGVGVPFEHGQQARAKAAFEVIAGTPVVAAEVEAGGAAGEEEGVGGVVVEVLGGGRRKRAGRRKAGRRGGCGRC
jgi:hypothetical protein